MRMPDDAPLVPLQHAEVSERGQVTQVGGDYEEHHHRYVRGWEYLYGTSVDDGEMDLAEHAFVEVPDGYHPSPVAQAVSILRSTSGLRSVLVILGEKGTGRRAAALRVLHRAGVPRQQIRWLLPDWERPRTEQLPYTQGHGFVLDLTDFPSLPEGFYTGLADYQKAAEAAEAVLIILATPGAWDPGARATVPSVQLARPPARKIAEAHLRYLKADRVDWLISASLDGLLAEEAQPADAARLARLVAGAEADGQDTLAQEFKEWEGYLRGWFEDHSSADDLRERALLVAAALLEGGPAHMVMEAADHLFTKVQGVLPPGGPLAGRDLYARLKTIGASPVGEGISLEDQRHGCAEAVLTYVWQQRPPLRRVLLEWASDISAPNRIATGHVGRIADSLAQLSLRPGGAMVLSVASSWIESGHATHKRLAVEILETMALHPVTGAGVRKQLYDWAHQKNTSEALATAVADICASRLGETYPRMALTRLRLLASRPDGRGQKAVASAVRALANTPERRVLVLSEILEWSVSASAVVRHAGVTTFLALSDVTSDGFLPLPPAQDSSTSTADALITRLIVRGWRTALLDPAMADTAHQQLAAWLDSPQLADEQVLRLAAAALRGHVGKQGTSALLVGTADSGELGLARRRTLLDQLITEQATAPAQSDTAAEPSGESTLPAA
ncbi:hypothetical protein [Streptomyces phaeochromogenes]|uniref:hypothetical protein n=1 Tax=Streptomyces phaeochromogenes TaxID=1923 RepID=UPI003714F7E0